MCVYKIAITSSLTLQPLRDVTLSSFTTLDVILLNCRPDSDAVLRDTVLRRYRRFIVSGSSCLHGDDIICVCASLVSVFPAHFTGTDKHDAQITISTAEQGLISQYHNRLKGVKVGTASSTP